MIDSSHGRYAWACFKCYKRRLQDKWVNVLHLFLLQWFLGHHSEQTEGRRWLSPVLSHSPKTCLLDKGIILNWLENVSNPWDYFASWNSSCSDTSGLILHPDFFCFLVAIKASLITGKGVCTPPLAVFCSSISARKIWLLSFIHQLSPNFLSFNAELVVYPGFYWTFFFVLNAKVLTAGGKRINEVDDTEISGKCALKN